MRAMKFDEDRKLVMEEREPDPIGSGELAVDVAYCGICGSDLHLLRNKAQAGTVPGHELSGRVAEVGAEVEGWEVGRRVVIQPFSPCGHCRACLKGKFNLCPEGLGDGVGLAPLAADGSLGEQTRTGGYSERVAVLPSQIVPLPDGVSDEAGALVEPLAVAVHAVRLADPDPTRPIVVFGAGPIGLMTLFVLRDRGAEKVLLVEPHEPRGKWAAGLVDAVHTTPERLLEDLGGAFGGEAPAAVFDCAGHPSVLPTAIEIADREATIMVVGMAEAPVPLMTVVVLVKELQLRGSSAYTGADIEAAIDLLDRDGVPVDEVVTAVVDLERAQEMFEELLTPGTEQVKVLLTPTA
jgi:(R,R)-butanediol dehydrogenase/meso-butanediol dehydrogenase/diacetyl reductase